MASPLKLGSKLTAAARTQILRRVRTLHACGLALHVACAVTYLECAEASPAQGASHFRRMFRGPSSDWQDALTPTGEAHAAERHEYRRTMHGHADNAKRPRYFCEPLDWAAHAMNGSNPNSQIKANAQRNAATIFARHQSQLPGGAPTPDPNAPANTTGQGPVGVATPSPAPQQPQKQGAPAVHIDAPSVTQAPGQPEIAPVTLPSQLGTHAPIADGGHGSAANVLRMPGEPAVAAALVDALKGRRRSITRRGLDTGELDVSPSRLALTGGGLDLGRAWQRRTAPDTRQTVVGVLLDYSGSMNAGHGSAQGSRYQVAARAAAMILRALERERIAGALWRYAGAGAEPVRSLRPVKTPLADALRQLDIRPNGPSTDAPRAGADAAKALVRLRADRRVLIVLCDDDMRHDDAQWAEIERAGIEVWGISIDADPAAGWTTLPDAAGWAHRWRTGADNLTAGWAAAMRADLGRIEV